MNSNLEMILNISIRIYDWFYNNVNKEKNLEMQKLSSLPFQMKNSRIDMDYQLIYTFYDVKKIEFGFLAISLYLFCIVFILSKDEKMI